MGRLPRHRKQRPRPATQMAAMRRWWLNHPLSPDEIREIASMIRPHDRPPRPKTSPAVLALTASGDPSDDGGKADLEVSVEVARAVVPVRTRRRVGRGDAVPQSPMTAATAFVSTRCDTLWCGPAVGQSIAETSGFQRT